MRALLAFLSLLALTFSGTGCGAAGPGPSCTLIGCVGGVTFQLPEQVLTAGTRVTACADGTCTTFTVTADMAPEPEADPGAQNERRAQIGTSETPRLAPLFTIPIELGSRSSVAVSLDVRRDSASVPVTVPHQVPVDPSEPNGPGCGSCRSATVNVAMKR